MHIAYPQCLCMHLCKHPCEQLLLQKYKVQRHAVYFKRYLVYQGLKSFQGMQICLSVPQSHKKQDTPTQSVKISTLSQFPH